MKIFNLHSDSVKDAQDFQVITNDEYDSNGKLVTRKYVQFTIIGNNHTWPDFMSIKDFKKLNPKVKVKGVN